MDVAARLCKTADKDQLVVSGVVFRGAGGEEAFPYVTEPVRRQILGVPDPQVIYAVAADRADLRLIPSSGDLDPVDPEVARELRDIEKDQLQLLKVSDRKKRLDLVDRLILRCRVVLKNEQDMNFIANCRLAELILHKIVVMDDWAVDHPALLEEALRCTGMAIIEQPYSPRPWDLRAWVRYQQFVRNSDNEALLDKALRHAQRAVDRAERMHIANELILAKTAHALFLTEKAKRMGFGPQTDEITCRAKQEMDDLQDLFQQEVENATGDFYVAKTFVAMMANKPPKEVFKYASKATLCNTKCVLIKHMWKRALLDDGLKGRYPQIVGMLEELYGFKPGSHAGQAVRVGRRG